MTNTIQKQTFSQPVCWISTVKRIEIQRKKASRHINGNCYHYAANNLIRYSDPDGNFVFLAAGAIGAVIGAAVSVGVVATTDMLMGNVSSPGTYIGAAVGGAVTGAVLATTANSVFAGAVTGLIPGAKVPGVTAGKGSMQAVTNQVTRKLSNETISSISLKTSAKVAISRNVNGALVDGTISSPLLSKFIKDILPEHKTDQKQNNEIPQLYIKNAGDDNNE